MKRLTVVCALLSAALATQAVEFYVSPTGNDGNDGSAKKPVKTLQRALDLTREIKREEQKTIVMKDGFYPFDKPVVFGRDDYDITVRAEHSRKAILSGAVKLSGWKTDAQDKRFLVAELPFEPEEGVNYMMTCGGEDRPVAVYPEKGRMKFKGGADTGLIAYDASTFPEGADLGSLDLASVWLEIPQEWATTVTLIKENDTEGRTFSLKTKAGMPFTRFNQGFRMYNCRLGMVKPGSWMYEATAKRVVYWPREGETAKTIDCRVARTGVLLAAAHSPGVTFRGLVLEGCTKTLDKKDKRAHPYADAPNLAALFSCWSRNVVVDDCEVRHCAGTGIWETKPTRCVVKNSHIHDIGGDGINFFDGGDASDILNCEVHDYGKTSAAAMGIHMQLSNVKCIGNHVHHGSGNGVVMWSRNSVFASNELHHVMQRQKDGGGLYGGMTDSVLKDNYVHDIGWPGLYVDEGSQRVLYTGNRFENCWWPIHAHCSQYVTVSNNMFRCDRPMRFSFQGSGHGIFCDNKIYTKEKPKDDPYVANCDFWGRNKFFLQQGNGSYKAAGELTLRRTSPKPPVFDLPRVPEKGRLPIGLKGEVDWMAFIKPMRWDGVTGVGADGFPCIGVPSVSVYICYDELYLYFGIVRHWNALCSYPGMRNATSTGWGHCDAVRLAFEGDRALTVFPDGTCEAAGRIVAPGKDDFSFKDDGSFIVRISLESLKIKGARKKSVRLDLETEDDGLLLTDEAADAARKPEKNLPKPFDVVGCSLKFNVSAWMEDLREEKSLFAPKGKDYATGTMRFAAPPRAKK